jgi:hypothetical protein
VGDDVDGERDEATVGTMMRWSRLMWVKWREEGPSTKPW